MSAEVAAHLITDALEQDDDTAILFKGRLSDAWSLELWVMPYKPAPQKLYRIKSIGSGGMLLKQFTNPEMLQAGHRKLYMEAHLWPKQYEKVETKNSGRDSKQPPAKKTKRDSTVADADDLASTGNLQAGARGGMIGQGRAKKSAPQGGSKLRPSRNAKGGTAASAVSIPEASSSGLSPVPEEGGEVEE